MAKKDRPFTAALNRQIDACGGHPDLLDKAAMALLRKAGAGDVQAIKELGDRLDGKATQETVAEVTHRYVIEAPAQLTAAEWEKEYGNDSLPTSLSSVPHNTH